MEKMKNLFKVMSILLVLFILVSCDNPPQIKKVEVSFNYDQEIISVVEIDKDTNKKIVSKFSYYSLSALFI